MQASPLLTVSNVSQRFGGNAALTDVSFSVESGSVVGVVGPNGAGKSTLLEIISGFQRPAAGTVHFCGEPVHQLRPDQRCVRGITRTFQKVEALPELSVMENVLVASFLRHRRREAATAAASGVLAQVGLSAISERHAKDLNQGELRRLDVARGLATEPRLLLLDEMMAGLNPDEVDGMVATLRDVHHAGVTLVIVEHNIRALREVATEIIALNAGRLLAQGPPDEVLQMDELVDAYLGTGASDA